MRPAPIQATVFDAAGTLFHLREPVGVGYSRVALRHGFALDPEAAEIAFRHAWKSMPRFGTTSFGKRSGDQAEKAWWRELVSRVLEAASPGACARPDAYFEDLFTEYSKPELWRLFPEVIHTLEELSSRPLRLFVLSNFDSRLLPVLDGHGLLQYFEQIFYSGAIAHAKPSLEAFDHAVSRIGIPAASCLHVGDDPLADWQGARSAGLQVFELDREQADLSNLLELPNLPDFSD
ncbi:MAG: HAD-IA family hydrolase [Verrucomicrobiales bacterium]